MLVATCNRCGKPVRYNNFKFEITEKNISGSLMDNFDGPDIRLDDFHLCPHCMGDFVDWIKEGKELCANM
jgi:hypothetical protein